MMQSNSGSASGKWAILDIDPYLKDHSSDINLRMQRYQSVRSSILDGYDSLSDFANGWQYFGFHRTSDGWVYREWAPAAEALFLLGDFNDWNRSSHPLTRLDNGVWEIKLVGENALPHMTRVKVAVRSGGLTRDRIPLYINYVVQDPQTHDFNGQIWAPAEEFQWTDQAFRIPAGQAPIIYETHVGMAQEREGIGTWDEFAENTLPRIKALGYNTVQIMAVMQHPYYASFGYHVSSCFAPSSWFGDPDGLKRLIDRAHALGLTVLMDMVQSHAVKNISEGLNEFDGTDYQFFHSGERGNHSAWDSKLFNYGKHEVIHFLLSSLKYWLDEFHFDGFRFDGVTSMIYLDHGLGTAFDSYDKYFSLNTDIEAITYLQLANELIHERRPDGLSIAEDMSGMPGMCLPIEAGGIGFDYRLAMGMPDFWVKTVKKRDEDWDMWQLWHELTTTRPGEKRIGYAESHDQALVGDKTLIFRMADKEMYWFMNKDSSNIVIDRAIALHKMIRLATISMGSDGWLNFMGNEFGHPEWIDFPREGNGWSYKYCRRQWSLADSPCLRYSDLNRFDQAMTELMSKYEVLSSEQAPKQLWLDQDQKLLAYYNNGLVFLLNFHPFKSIDGFRLPLHLKGQWQVVLDSDEERFGGQNRISHEIVYDTVYLDELSADGIVIYSPCRTALVLSQR